MLGRGVPKSLKITLYNLCTASKELHLRISSWMTHSWMVNFYSEEEDRGVDASS